MRSTLPKDLMRLLSAPERAPVFDDVVDTARLGWRRVVLRAEQPLRRGLFGRLFRRPTVGPALPQLCSKIGGMPYLEAEEDWPREASGELCPFVAQLYFKDLPPMEGLPAQGVLSIFLPREVGLEPLITRWVAEPYTDRAVSLEGSSRSAWECRVEAASASTVAVDLLQGLDSDLEVTSWLSEHGADVCCWPAGGHLGTYGPRDFIGPAPMDPDQWLQLWEVTCDEADIYFGSMSVSLMIHREDLKAARFDRLKTMIWQ